MPPGGGVTAVCACAAGAARVAAASVAARPNAVARSDLIVDSNIMRLLLLVPGLVRARGCRAFR